MLASYSNGLYAATVVLIAGWSWPFQPNTAAVGARSMAASRLPMIAASLLLASLLASQLTPATAATAADWTGQWGDSEEVRVVGWRGQGGRVTVPRVQPSTQPPIHERARRGAWWGAVGAVCCVDMGHVHAGELYCGGAPPGGPRVCSCVLNALAPHRIVQCGTAAPAPRVRRCAPLTRRVARPNASCACTNSQSGGYGGTFRSCYDAATNTVQGLCSHIGFVYGEVDPADELRLTGTWIEAGGATDVPNWGTFQLTMAADGSYFVGDWLYAGSDDGGSWRETRLAGAPAPTLSQCGAGPQPGTGEALARHRSLLPLTM